jgi:tetratricopeptide (TPR) repeat protein
MTMARRARSATTSRDARLKRGGRSVRPTILVGAIAIAVIALIGYGGFVMTRHLASRAQLPQLPAVAGQPPAVRQHLLDKYEGAQRAPASPSAVGALCLAFHADMFYAEADRCHLLAERLAPQEWRWTYYRALLQSERGNAEAVANGMRRVVERAPTFGPAWWWLGDAEFKQGHYERAEEAWQRAASLPEVERDAVHPSHAADVPLTAFASLGLARVALVRGDNGSARDILERLTARAPRFGSGFRLLAESYELLGRQADADRARFRASRLPPYAPYADPMVDALARESRNSTFLIRQASEADLAVNGAWSEYLTRRALEFDPDNPDVLSKLGRLLRTFGRSDEALEFFVRYQQLVPGDIQVLGHIGGCLSDLGRFEEAEPFLRRALTGLDDALTHYNLGALLAATGRFDEAIAEYERAVERDPYDSDVRTNLAAVLVRKGKLAQASRELRRALELDPENVGALTNLGLVYAEQGQFDRAAAEFEAALRINPRQPQALDALRALGR